MSELEKKLSDFQKSDCKDFELDKEDQRPEKVCPTCIPNPNFVLPASWWEIPEAYFNEAECEYHVALQPRSVSQGPDGSLIVGPLPLIAEGGNVIQEANSAQKSEMLSRGAEKILKDLKKPYDDEVLEAIASVCFIKDGPYSNLNVYPPFYLIACPSFSIDRIQEDDVDENKNDPTTIDTPKEFKVDALTLSKNIRQLRIALELYKSYYAYAQLADNEGFVIRQENNITQRISYEEPRKKLRTFKDEINRHLKKNGYARIQDSGFFTAKRAKSLKFVFKADGGDYELEEIYALPDSGCLEYEPLGVGNSNVLTSKTMRIVYHFLSKIDRMISEIQAQEPKPWAEWTLDHWYPTMILENKSDLNIDEVESGLSCLLEQELGLGPELVDSLSKEIASIFKKIQQESEEQACRELEKQAEKSATSLAENRNNNKPDPKEQRRLSMIKRYTEQYKNEFLQNAKEVIRRINESEHYRPEGSPEIPEPKDLIELFRKSNTGTFAYAEKTAINYFRPKTYKVKGEYIPQDEKLIESFDELETAAAEYASTKFYLLEGTENNPNINPFDQVKNSPHYHDAIDAYREAKKFPENGVIDLFSKEGSFSEIIDALGVCGVSKIGKKAAQCILGNISISDFYDALINKFFEFIKINVLDLFLADIPAGLRADLDDAIAKEFGSGVNLYELISIKKVNEGEAKLSDIVRTKDIVKRVYKLYSKTLFLTPSLSVGFQISNLSIDEFEFMKNSLGMETELGIETVLEFKNTDGTGSSLGYLMAFSNGLMGQGLSSKEKNDYKKQATKIIKQIVRDNLKSKKQRAFNRVGSFSENQGQKIITPGNTVVVNHKLPSEFEKAAAKFESTAVGEKVDVVFDLVFDYTIDWILEELTLDELIDDIKKYPATDFLLDQIWNALTCPTAPVIYPPPSDFMKGLTFDICDPTKGLEIPKIVWPNINPFATLQAQWPEIVREKIIDLAGNIIEGIVKKFVSTIEGSLCSALGIGVNALADFARDREGFKNTFLDALNEAFCNGSENPETSRSRAEELAEALFTPLLFQEGSNYEGAAEKITNVISSVASTEEFLSALVARDDQEDQQFGTRISNAVNHLTPEISALLGSPDQVAYFFRTIGSFLSADDRERIRDLLAAGIPNLPISKSICLTDEQLEDWNDLRRELLSDYPDPQTIVDDLNDRTILAAEEILDLVGQVGDSNGPFAGPIVDEINKDACNPGNILNDVSQSDLDKILEDEGINSEYENLSRIMSFSFMRANGLLGHALRDKEGEAEFKRKFYKFIFPGYTNSSAEWQTKYDAKNPFGQFFMDNYNDGNPRGNYPSTVGLKQREDILSGEKIVFNFKKIKTNAFSSRNITFIYKDSFDPSYRYKLHVAASLLQKSKSSFDYNVQVLEDAAETNLIAAVFDSGFERQISFDTPIFISDEERGFLDSLGVQINESQFSDLRKETFNKLMSKIIPVNHNYDNLYEKTYKMITTKMTEALLTDYRKSDGLPPGYKFGYVSDALKKESFTYYNPDGVTEYDLDEEEQTLGVFGSSRITALDPNLYGGKYSRPKYYIEPRQFSGWVELAAKAFESPDGCDPARPPLLDMSDIKQREKNLANTLRNDPRLSRQPECIQDIPFKALINSKGQAKMDAVVRSTLRIYLAEYFMKGYGLFSNLQIRFGNFDQSLPLYVINQIKREMIELGSFAGNRKVRIVRDRYWYTFLEQCVEAYVRMRDYDGLVPPPIIADALELIEEGLDLYDNITRKDRKSMRIFLQRNDKIKKPGINFNPINELKKGTINMGLMAVAFRLSPDQDNFFDGKNIEVGGKKDQISPNDIKFASIKKLKFFQKIYFIRLFEKEAILIASELIKDELNRLNRGVVDGLSDMPYYYDLKRAIFGMKSLFPSSTSKVGTNDFYSGLVGTGDVPEIKNTNETAPVTPSSEPQLLIEKYIRLVEKEDAIIPPQIKNRANIYRGAVSISKANELLNNNMNLLGDSYLSDFFGDLEFVYSSQITEIFDKGFADRQSLSKLLEENSNMETEILTSLQKYILGVEFDDFAVTHDSSYLLEGDEKVPTGTKGSTGVKQGLRVCLSVPLGEFSPQQIQSMKLDQSFNTNAKLEKSFVFMDNSVIIPLVTSEVDFVDSKISEFNFDRYDLECVINKMVEQSDFKIIFEKVFNTFSNSSMLAIYCMETMMPSIGRHASERSPDFFDDPDVDDWDGTINVFLKNIMRKRFKSLYLSNHVDGLSPDRDDGSEFSFLRLSNPIDDLLDGVNVKIPFWTRRRRVFKAKDRFGEDCADPKKDLR